MSSLCLQSRDATVTLADELASASFTRVDLTNRSAPKELPAAAFTDKLSRPCRPLDHTSDIVVVRPLATGHDYWSAVSVDAAASDELRPLIVKSSAVELVDFRQRQPANEMRSERPLPSRQHSIRFCRNTIIRQWLSLTNSRV